MSHSMTWRTALILSAVLHLMLLPGLAGLSPKEIPQEEKNLIELDLTDYSETLPLAANSPYLPPSAATSPAAQQQINNHFAAPSAVASAYYPAQAAASGDNSAYSSPAASSTVAASDVIPSGISVASAAPAAPPPQSVTIPARVQSMVKPVYPEQARLDGLEGNVSLIYEVLTNGQVGNVRISRSSGYQVLDEAAIQAVKQWRFTPARDSVSGEAKEYTKGVTLTFSLNS